MKIRYRYSTLILSIAAFGVWLFSLFSCSTGGEEAAMSPGNYDMLSPTNNYTLNGKVVSKTNKESALPNILMEISIEKNHPVIDTLYTDINGNFEWTGTITTFSENAKLNIAATDTTGKYKKNSMTIEFSENDMSKESNAWFFGEAEKTLTIKLEEN